MIAIIDYGMGNLKNIYKALEYVNADCVITSDPETVLNADGIVLPGVGAFKDAMECINARGLAEPVRISVNQGKQFLGICLGLQLLFDKSFENGEYEGLGLVSGDVDIIEGNVKVPHMGWNSLDIQKPDDPLLYGVLDPVVYFVHSYYCRPAQQEIISSSAEYGVRVTSSIWKENIHGLQFHPEKSGEAGLKMLDNFRGLVK